MGRRQFRKGDRDYDRFQKLVHQNKQLKRQVDRLQKLLDRVDFESHQNVQEVLEKHAREESDSSRDKLMRKLRKQWECWQCRTGVLKILTLERRDGTFYFRKCDNPECGHRTKLQKWSAEVKGLKDGSGTEDQD